MFLSKEKIRSVNLIQLEILKNIIHVCNKLKLNYFLVHGTLLGALLYSGFVPYDDDIDIAMPRIDYDKFLREATKHLPEQYFVQSHLSESGYPLTFAKVRDSNTTYLSYKYRDINLNQGIYVDIFPIDYTDGKPKTLLNKLLDYRISTLINKKRSPKESLILSLSIILFPSLKKTIEKREKLLTKFSNGDYVRITGGKPTEEKIPAEWFESTLNIKFCGLDCNIPVNYELYLKKIYGKMYSNTTLLENRMYFEGQAEMNADIIDPEKSYKEYI